MTDTPYCNGTWSLSRKRQFIISALRRASGRWAPKYACKKAARVARNEYRCASCSQTVGNSECHVDHINPVVDPVVGFQGWDIYVERLFVERDGYRLLCKTCHAEVTQKQREVRKANKK